MRLHILVSLVGASASALAAPTSQPLPTVTVKGGVIVGTSTALPSAVAAVNQYLGIPFANSPPERFAPPDPVQPWTQPLNASAWKPACIQQFVYPKSTRLLDQLIFEDPGYPPPQESEDCLYLNVYAPASPPPVDGWPVMFWIHGGNLQYGTAGIPMFDGSSIAANQDVIVVTTNYRTNVFGFPNSPNLELGEQNLGFLDQRKSLHWVKKNIEAFGGNSTKVTIFGESAGGYSVKQLVAVPPVPLSFRAAIVESGAIQFTQNSIANWQNLTALVGCSGVPDTLGCMRNVSASTLKNVTEVNILEFGPVYDNFTALADVSSAFKKGTAAQVPLLVGTNANEGTAFTTVGLVTPSAPFPVAQAFLTSLFGNSTQFQQALIGAYPTSISSSAFQLISAVITDLIFHCPTFELSTLASQSGYEVWRYYFNASFPNTQDFLQAGVWHTSEIPEVFGTYPATNVTSQEVGLSAFMQGAWANFTKNPAGGPGWPQLGTNNGTDLGGLGSNGSSGVQPFNGTQMDSVCALYKPAILAL